MTTMPHRYVGFAVGFILLGMQSAWAQKPNFEGAWLEDGLVCSDVFVSKGTMVGFKRPINVFVAAFIVRGQRISTPLATCRIGRMDSRAERQVLHLNCTTTIATEAMQAVFALTPDGGLDRYNAVDGGAAAKYRRCAVEGLKAP